MRIVLIVLLFLSSLTSAIFCVQIMAVAQSAVHEIEALIAGVTSSICFGAGTIAVCIEKLRADTVAAVNRTAQAAEPKGK